MVVLIHEKNAHTLSVPVMLGAAGTPFDSYTVNGSIVTANYELFWSKLERFPAASRTACKLSKTIENSCLTPETGIKLLEGSGF